MKMKKTAQSAQRRGAALPGLSFFCLALLCPALFPPPAACQTPAPAWYQALGLPEEDSDGDGIPDAWEKRTFGDPSAHDSGLDRDGDGLTDLEEFLYGSDPRTASTAGGFWTDKEKFDAGLAADDRADPPLSEAQWRAWLAVNAYEGLWWSEETVDGGFVPAYSGFVNTTPPYNNPALGRTLDFWLCARTDRPAWVTVGDVFTTNRFLLREGTRRVRLRAAYGGPVSLTLDPAPGTLASQPGATNGPWLCGISLEPFQSNTVVFAADSQPPSGGPPGLDGLLIEEAPPPGPVRPAGGPAPRIGARPLTLPETWDFAGVWCLCPCEEWPEIGSFEGDCPGGVTLNGQPAPPETPLCDKDAVFIPADEPSGAVTQSLASAAYPFIHRDIPFFFSECRAASGINGLESLLGAGAYPHEPFQVAGWACMLRGCGCPGGFTIAIGFSHEEVNTRNLWHPDEPKEDRKYQHCLGVVWNGQPVCLTNYVETFGINLAAAGCDIRWEVDGKLQSSPLLDTGDEPEDLSPSVFRVKMIRVFPNGKDTEVWDRLILVVCSPQTKALFDAWYARFSVEKAWLAELPAAYNSTFGVTTNLFGFWINTQAHPEPNGKPVVWNRRDTPGKYMHHLARWQMRSEKTPGGHGHQVCYDDAGSMIKHGMSAGTADYGAATSMFTLWCHVTQDVDPFVRALQLDGNPCRRSGTALDHALIHEGGNIGKYLECRPTIPNGKPLLSPGQAPGE